MATASLEPLNLTINLEKKYKDKYYFKIQILSMMNLKLMYKEFRLT